MTSASIGLIEFQADGFTLGHHLCKFTCLWTKALHRLFRVLGLWCVYSDQTDCFFGTEEQGVAVDNSEDAPYIVVDGCRGISKDAR